MIHLTMIVSIASLAVSIASLAYVIRTSRRTLAGWRAMLDDTRKGK